MRPNDADTQEGAETRERLAELATDLERQDRLASAAPWEQDRADVRHAEGAGALMCNARGHTIFDTRNSDEQLVQCDDGRYRDETGDLDFQLIATLRNNLPTILSALRQPQGLPERAFLDFVVHHSAACNLGCLSDAEFRSIVTNHPAVTDALAADPEYVAEAPPPSVTPGQDLGASSALSPTTSGARAEGWRTDLENAPQDRPLWCLRLDEGRPPEYAIVSLAERSQEEGHDGWFERESGDEMDPPVAWTLASIPARPDNLADLIAARASVHAKGAGPIPGC